MSKEREFIKWFDGLQLKNFTAEEVLSYFNRKNNDIPPSNLWENAVRVLQLVDMLRDKLGKPIRITSSYRSPAYNAGVGGAKRSQHLQFGALDIQCMGASPNKVHTLLKKWRDAGVFKGGLKQYSTFVHFDTRGHNTTW